MHFIIEKSFLILFFCLQNFEKVFGLSQFTFRNKSFKLLFVLSFLIKVLLVILYPFTYIKLLNFEEVTDSVVTTYARNLTFVMNCLLIGIIYFNEVFNMKGHLRVSCQLENMFKDLISQQNFKQNLVLLFRCSVKLTVILYALMYASAGKFKWRLKRNLEAWERNFVVVLMLPFVILTFTLNRIYVANTVTKQLLVIEANKLVEKQGNKALKIAQCSVSYKNLHNFFEEFNKLNAQNLITIITFCVLNIVYEVISSSAEQRLEENHLITGSYFSGLFLVLAHYFEYRE